MTEPTLNFHIQTHQTQFKIPVELIKKNFKSIQKLIEKQKKQLTEDINKIKKIKNLSNESKLELIQKLIKNFEIFNKKLINSIKKDEEFRSRLIARLENLQELEKFVIHSDVKTNKDKDKNNDNNNSSSNDDDKSNGNSESTDEGDKVLDLHNPNLINCNNGKLMKLIDYDLFENFNKVFVSIIQNHDLTLIISWFNENRNALKKINSNLEFEINYCKFLTLIENGDINEAINYSREHLSSYGNKENYPDERDNLNHLINLERLKSLGGLLVFRSMEQQQEEDLQNSNQLTFSNKLMINSIQFKEYQKLLSNERWESLSQCFIENFTKLYGITKNYPIYIYLSAGLSSLKTKSCYHNSENTIFKDLNTLSSDNMDTDKLQDLSDEENIVLSDKKYRGPNYYYQLLNKINNCPVCSPELFKLSQNLPYAQLITSIFNNPFKLPNGNIYPFDKLLSPNDKYLSEKNTLLRLNQIKDPLTKEIFSIDNCIRVFPA
ncbi:Protein FYV10 [Candida tropicalis]